MSIDPKSIQPGQCYLMLTGHVRRVIALYPGRVQYETRFRHNQRTGYSWRAGIFSLQAFAAMVERPVPCDWSLESDEA